MFVYKVIHTMVTLIDEEKDKKKSTMVSKPLFSLLLLTVALVVFQTGTLVNAEDSEPSSSTRKPLVKIVKGKKLCDKGWECKGWSEYCCNHTISDFFETYQFENLFSKRNSPVAHAVGFWDYRSFITAAAEYQPLGFGTAGEKLQGMKEVAAFLGHVGSKTSCKFNFRAIQTGLFIINRELKSLITVTIIRFKGGDGVATGGPLAWGLCYNKEMSPDQLYCDDYYKLTYPCTPGVSYHGRGALPVYWYVV